MPPLKNIKHEKFAHAVINSDSQTQAYKEVYGTEGKAPEVCASRLLSSVNVRERVLELMQQSEATSIKNVLEKLGNGINSENEGIMMDGVKTAMKAYGVFEEAKESAGLNAIQIVFSSPEAPKQIDSSPNDPK